MISGRPISDTPASVVIGNRVIRTCCGQCMKEVLEALKDPRGSVVMADAAAQKAPPTGV